MVIVQEGDQRAALGALLNAPRYSKDQPKTLAYFNQLSENDPRDGINRLRWRPFGKQFPSLCGQLAD